MKETDELLNERGSVYGDFTDNAICAYELKNIFNVAMVNNELAAFGDMERSIFHKEGMEYVLEKIARIATGSLHEDNYKDAIGYLELIRRKLYDR